MDWKEVHEIWCFFEWNALTKFRIMTLLYGDSLHNTKFIQDCLSIQGHNQLCKISPKIRTQNKASQDAQVSALNVMAAAGMTSSVFRDQKHKPVGKNNAFTSDVRCLHTLVGPMLGCYSSYYWSKSTNSYYNQCTHTHRLILKYLRIMFRHVPNRFYTANLLTDYLRCANIFDKQVPLHYRLVFVGMIFVFANQTALPCNSKTQCPTNLSREISRKLRKVVRTLF